MKENIIDENKELHIHLAVYYTTELMRPPFKITFPSKIYAHEFDEEKDRNEPIVYIPLKKCSAKIIMGDDNAIGHCTCSNCNKTIGFYDKYCSNCGGKITSKIIEGEDV